MVDRPSGVLVLVPIGCFTTRNNASQELKQNVNTVEWQAYMGESDLGQVTVKY